MSTKTVLALGKLNFSGNITPPSWYQHIKTEKGRPDLVSVTLLSEIIYWYRPVTVRDEATGAVIEQRKKFKADKLQRSRGSFAEQFGISKKQVSDALKNLARLSLITLEYRTVETAGMTLPNTLFIEPIADEIERITYAKTPPSPVSPISNTVSPISNTPLPKSNTLLPISQTITEITTKSSTEITTEEEDEKSKKSSSSIKKLKNLLGDDFTHPQIQASYRDWLKNYSLELIEKRLDEAKRISPKWLYAFIDSLNGKKALPSESRDISRGASVPGQGPPKLESLDLERRLELRATHVKRSYTSALESKLNASDSLESASSYARSVALEAWAISSEDHELDRDEDEFEYVISSAGSLARQAIKMRNDTERKLMDAGLRSEASSWGLAAYQHTLSENYESLLELETLIQKRIQGVRLEQGLAKDAHEVAA